MRFPEEAARARIPPAQFIAFFDLSFRDAMTDKLLGAYSKGMRRKVVITAALLRCNPPRWYFFDEPSLDGLDTRTRR